MNESCTLTGLHTTRLSRLLHPCPLKGSTLQSSCPRGPGWHLALTPAPCSTFINECRRKSPDSPLSTGPAGLTSRIPMTPLSRCREYRGTGVQQCIQPRRDWAVHPYGSWMVRPNYMTRWYTGTRKACEKSAQAKRKLAVEDATTVCESENLDREWG